MAQVLVQPLREGISTHADTASQKTKQNGNSTASTTEQVLRRSSTILGSTACSSACVMLAVPLPERPATMEPHTHKYTHAHKPHRPGRSSVGKAGVRCAHHDTSGQLQDAHCISTRWPTSNAYLPFSFSFLPAPFLLPPQTTFLCCTCTPHTHTRQLNSDHLRLTTQVSTTHF